jgi:predicted permease
VGAIWQNLRYTVRVLRKNLGFTTVAVLSLALGIGANTAIFTLINALLLRELPVRDPERLVELSLVRGDRKIPLSFPIFQELERGQRVFSSLIGWGGAPVNVEVNSTLLQANVLGVTGSYYLALGANPVLGRLLTPDDVNLSGGATHEIAVIDYQFWQHHFGGAFDVVGKQIRIEGHPFTIIGVTRKWFTGMMTGQATDITIPISAQPLIQGNDFRLDNRSVLWLSVTGRLKDGITLDQARAQLQSFWPDVLAATVSTQTPGPRRDAFFSMGLDVAPAATGIAKDLREQFTRPLYILSGIVGLILLAACINLTNLMLARSAARSHEMSVRVALGATRWTLVRQALIESLLLSLTGALLGLVFAYWGSRLLVILMTQGFLTPVALDLTPDLRVLGLTVSVAILTGILLGLASGWRSSREDPASTLQQNARSVTGALGGLSKALIVTQVTLSLVLLLGAGLLVRSFQRLHSIDLGFEKESLLEITLKPKPGGYRDVDMSSYRQQLIARVADLPGVRSVSFADDSFPSQQTYRESVSLTSTDASSGAHVMAGEILVSRGFFATLGITLVRGRDFHANDAAQHPSVAIISSSLANVLFPDGSALGQHIRVGFMPATQNLEVIGVAGDARLFDLRDPATPTVYFSMLQDPARAQWGSLLVRTGQAPEAIARTVGHEIESLGREYPLRTKTASQVISDVLVEERVVAMLSAFFAAIALVLASIGLYGLMSYAVTRRTREIGTRVALGAQQRNILWIVLRETIALTLFGIALGVPCALAASRLIASTLFSVSSTDAPTLTAMSLLLLGVALFAGYLPARRASAIDPIIALRTE